MRNLLKKLIKSRVALVHKNGFVRVYWEEKFILGFRVSSRLNRYIAGIKGENNE
jgi:hypothetical protein